MPHKFPIVQFEISATPLSVKLDVLYSAVWNSATEWTSAKDLQALQSFMTVV